MTDALTNSTATPALVPVPTPPDAPAGVPTLYEWLGGIDTLLRLTTLFYSRVPDDPLLGPVFARMSPDHPRHVAQFLGEVLGGPPTYSAELGGDRGGHVRMVSHHLGRMLTEPQRARWVQLLLACADEIALPNDPEFRSAFVAYLEWGTRIAVLNSAPGITEPQSAPMPKWGWGVPGGPYQP